MDCKNDLSANGCFSGKCNVVLERYDAVVAIKCDRNNCKVYTMKEDLKTFRKNFFLKEMPQIRCVVCVCVFVCLFVCLFVCVCVYVLCV